MTVIVKLGNFNVTAFSFLTPAGHVCIALSTEHFRMRIYKDIFSGKHGKGLDRLPSA